MATYPQMHVKRIYRQNADGSQDNSTWIDVLRVDKFYTNSRASPDHPVYQGAVWSLKWLDQSAENVNQTRKTHTLTLYNPVNGPQDPPPQSGDQSTVDLWLVDRLTTATNGYWSGLQGQGAKRLYKNYMASQTTDPTKYTTLRKTDSMRVVNNDLGGLDMTQGDVDWPTYLAALKAGKQDQTNYVDVELVKTFKTNANPQREAWMGATDENPPMRFRPPYQGGVVTHKAFGLDTLGTLAEVFSASPGDADPVFRTDPYQLVVNVNWAAPEMAVLYNQTGSVSEAGVASGAAFQVIDQKGRVLWTNGPPPYYSDPHQRNDFGVIFNAMTPTLRGDNAPSGMAEEPVVAISGTLDIDSNAPRIACYDKSGNLKWKQDFSGFPEADTSSSNNCAVYADCDADGNIAFLLEIFTDGGDQWEYIGKLKGLDGSVMFAQDWASNHLVDETNLLSATPGNIQDSSSIRCAPDGTIAGTFGSWWMVGGFASSMVSILCYNGANGEFKGGSQIPPPSSGSGPSSGHGPWNYTYTNNMRGFTALQNNTFIVLEDLRKQGQGPLPDETWPGWPDVFPVVINTADEWYYLEAYSTSGDLISQTTFYHGSQFLTQYSDHSTWTPPEMPPPPYTPSGFEGRGDGSFWAAHMLASGPGVDNITPSIDLFNPDGGGPTLSFSVPFQGTISTDAEFIPNQVSSISVTFGAPTITYPVTDALVQFKGDGSIDWQIRYPYVGADPTHNPIGMLMSPRPINPL